MILALWGIGASMRLSDGPAAREQAQQRGRTLLFALIEIVAFVVIGVMAESWARGSRRSRVEASDAEAVAVDALADDAGGQSKVTPKRAELRAGPGWGCRGQSDDLAVVRSVELGPGTA